MRGGLLYSYSTRVEGRGKSRGWNEQEFDGNIRVVLIRRKNINANAVVPGRLPSTTSTGNWHKNEEVVCFVNMDPNTSNIIESNRQEDNDDRTCGTSIIHFCFRYIS